MKCSTHKKSKNQNIALWNRLIMWEITSVNLNEKIFLELCNYLFYPGSIDWEQSISKHICEKLWSYWLREEDVLILSIYFRYFLNIISPSNWAWSIISIHLNLRHQITLCAKFGWNWLSGSGEENGEDDENVKS